MTRSFATTRGGKTPHIMTVLGGEAECQSGLKLDIMGAFVMLQQGERDPLPGNLCKRCAKLVQQGVI